MGLSENGEQLHLSVQKRQHQTVAVAPLRRLPPRIQRPLFQANRNANQILVLFKSQCLDLLVFGHGRSRAEDPGRLKWSSKAESIGASGCLRSLHGKVRYLNRTGTWGEVFQCSTGPPSVSWWSLLVCSCRSLRGFPGGLAVVMVVVMLCDGSGISQIQHDIVFLLKGSFCSHGFVRCL